MRKRLPGKETGLKDEANIGPMFIGVEHVGIAVKDTERAAALMVSLFGARRTGTSIHEERGLKLTFLELAGLTVELLEPVRSEGPVAKFLEARGEGFHHIAFGVRDIHKALEDLRTAGIELVDPVPRKGTHGDLIAFVHPSSTHGVLIELCQKG